MTPVEQIIRERIQREGPMTFAEFMRLALYEPNYGYYVIGPARMGWEGKDYFTSSDVSPLFAHCMGRQLLTLWEQLTRPTPFVVVEQGAGRGDLGREIITWAHQEQADFATALQYDSEDIKSGVDAVQHAQEDQPHVLLSNELVDAFPVHIVEVRDQQLYEVYIDLSNGIFREILMEPSTPQLVAYLAQHHVPWQGFPDGWRTEINLDALIWMRNTAHRLSGVRKRRRNPQGYLVTIDYGDKAQYLYTRERRYGTLASYFQHRLSNRPLMRAGEQDITAHVNFSALIAEGRAQGLRLDSFTTQRVWLQRTGLHEEIERVRIQEFALADSARASDQGQVALLQWYNLRQRVAALTDSSGMGNFKVLIMKW